MWYGKVDEIGNFGMFFDWFEIICLIEWVGFGSMDVVFFDQFNCEVNGGKVFEFFVVFEEELVYVKVDCVIVRGRQYCDVICLEFLGKGLDLCDVVVKVGLVGDLVQIS